MKAHHVIGAGAALLLMSVLWKGCTTRGAMIGGFMGLLSAVVLTVLSQAVWVDVFHFKSAPFPYTSPALFSMTIGFIGIWLVSVTDRSARARVDKAGFEAQQLRSETGIGAVEASAH